MAIIKQLIERLKNSLIASNYVHLRRNPTNSSQDVVMLIDRFLDDKLAYEMEWDDFISWKSTNMQVEGIRQNLGKFEPLLFSKAASDRMEYCRRVTIARNKLAALLNMPIRDMAFR